MTKHPQIPDVTIIGGGIAGLTAALRLVERGYAVAVYEREGLFGGNLGADRSQNVDFEVYPHMFGDWYVNFWNLVVDVLGDGAPGGGDLAAIRARHFHAVPDAGFLRPMPVGGGPKTHPHYRLLSDNGSWRTAFANLFSGILSPPQMFLAAYAVIDLLTQDYSFRGGRLFAGEQSLNGFLVSRFYATEAICEFYDMLIENIWSVDSYLISAYAFQCFSAFQFRRPSPQCWALRNNSYQGLIEPLVNRLKASGRCTLHAGVAVNRVVLGDDGRVARLHLAGAPGQETSQPVVNLILATSADSLARLVATPPGRSPQEGSPAATDAEEQLLSWQVRLRRAPIVRRLPQLANLRRLTSEPIPILYVTFKPGAFRAGDIPDCYVALQQSRYSLTFVKVNASFTASAPQELQEPGVTVLAIGASDFSSIPVRLHDGATEAERRRAMAVEDETHREAALLILKEFHRFIPSFRLGRHWGDPESDVIWDDEFTFFKVNLSQKLFINQVGSRSIAPRTHYGAVPNLYFAGDCCDNPIGIATVEAAVTSGLQAAAAVTERVRPQAGSPGGAAPRPVAIRTPQVYPLPFLFTLKLLLAPYAVMAKYLADGIDAWMIRPHPAADPASLLKGALGGLLGALGGPGRINGRSADGSDR